ncbi:hypothetical protein [Solimonas fluminis]|uniref:hypothetical protein n=1 Tax=Solimonas fluminis TaxID=2086571 RepID=UPI001057227B|nr:hypothetical protein [Solimonas fluminis]
MKKPNLPTLLFLSVLLAPVATYLCVFGTTLSDNHTRWAEFGSAIGGIYSPIIAILTLIVLLTQVSLQTQMNRRESDQVYLEKARTDIEFYSAQMAQAINGIAMPGKTLRMILHENFRPSSMHDLDSEILRDTALNIHVLMPHTFDIWAAIYPVLMGLEAGKGNMYEMTFASSIQKLAALLSYETCVALDNFHRVRCEGKLNVRYHFSPLLTKIYSSK